MIWDNAIATTTARANVASTKPFTSKNILMIERRMSILFLSSANCQTALVLDSERLQRLELFKMKQSFFAPQIKNRLYRRSAGRKSQRAIGLVNCRPDDNLNVLQLT